MWVGQGNKYPLNRFKELWQLFGKNELLKNKEGYELWKYREKIVL